MSDILEDLDAVFDESVAAQNGGPPLDPAWIAAIALLAGETIRELRLARVWSERNRENEARVIVNRFPRVV